MKPAFFRCAILKMGSAANGCAQAAVYFEDMNESET